MRLNKRGQNAQIMQINCKLGFNSWNVKTIKLKFSFDLLPDEPILCKFYICSGPFLSELYAIHHPDITKIAQTSTDKDNAF